MSVTACVKALYSFFGGFGLPAYAEEAVPDRDPVTGREVRPPYITVQLAAPDWRGSAPFYARIWYRSHTYAGIDAKADEIGEAIGEGVSVPAEGGGAVYIHKDDKFAQHQPFPEDPTLKCVYLSMTLMNHTN